MSYVHNAPGVQFRREPAKLFLNLRRPFQSRHVSVEIISLTTVELRNSNQGTENV